MVVLFNFEFFRAENFCIITTTFYLALFWSRDRRIEYLFMIFKTSLASRAAAIPLQLFHLYPMLAISFCKINSKE